VHANAHFEAVGRDTKRRAAKGKPPRSAVAAAAYRSGECLRDEQYGKTHDYTRKHAVQHSEISAPPGSPEWVQDRETLWNRVEASEKRHDAQLWRDVTLTLPRGLDVEQRADLVRRYVQESFCSRGMVADWSLHEPAAGDGKTNPHAHVMLTMRPVDGESFGKKERSWNDRGNVSAWRDSFQEHCNRALEDAGSSDRVDLRNNEAKGLDRLPEPKKGPYVHALQGKGIETRRGAVVAAVQKENYGRAVASYYRQGQRNPLSMAAIMEDCSRRYYQAAYGSEAAYGDLGYTFDGRDELGR
jgi:ATP-dependent exoDNAse (exonuclease V) alpha subunit